MAWSMTLSTNKGLFSAAALAAFSVLGCFDSGSRDPAVAFDRPAMLANLADRLILPGYREMQAASLELRESVDRLAEDKDSARAEEARMALRQAWLAWQKVSVYEWGPAAQVLLRQRLNTFPTHATKIETNISNGSWDLESVANYEAKGFPALDYLLNRQGVSMDTLIATLTDSVSGENRCRYMRALAEEIASQVTGVSRAWEPEFGNYRKSFIAKDGNDIGSSLGELVNQFNFDYEILKNPKIGIPLGKMTLGVALPEKVEAYYGGYSLALAKAQIEALENLFRGRDSLGDGLSLEDYLEALGTRYQQGELAGTIVGRFALARSALDAIPDPLSSSIQDETAKVEKAYEELQRMIVLIKSDMPSALSVSITYQDNDGD